MATHKSTGKAPTVSLAKKEPSKKNGTSGKSEKKSPMTMKASEKTAAPVAEVVASNVDSEEGDEHDEEGQAASASAGGNAAALAAASGTTEMSASFKNFRHHPDMENFYRFIFENDLRHEALAIIDEMMNEKLQRRMVKGLKAQPH